MSKILEFDAILKENLKDIHFRSPDQTYEAVIHCMVVAYNRALEDAVDVADIHYPASNNLNPTVDKDSILKLKIGG